MMTGTKRPYSPHYNNQQYYQRKKHKPNNRYTPTHNSHRQDRRENLSEAGQDETGIFGKTRQFDAKDSTLKILLLSLRQDLQFWNFSCSGHFCCACTCTSSDSWRVCGVKHPTTVSMTTALPKNPWELWGQTMTHFGTCAPILYKAKLF